MKALILGVNGQDGSLLTEHLIRAGANVVGIGRQPAPRIHPGSASFEYRQLDLRDGMVLARMLEEEQPDRIFHVAAVHTSAGGTYEPVFGDMLRVNVASVHVVLEHMRTTNPGARLIYASSAKVFGEPLPQVIDEQTPRVSRCLYSVTKNAARDAIDHYRRTHGLQAGAIYLFNHESALRPSSFFIPKVVSCLLSAKRRDGARHRFDTLRFHCDWGSAEEYMSILLDVAERAPGEDFVLGTGNCRYAAKFVEDLFARDGLDAWRWIEEVSREERQPFYTVNTAKLAAMVGRIPCVPIEDVLVRMLQLQPTAAMSAVL